MTKQKKSNCDKTEKLKWWPNWKICIVTKLKTHSEKTLKLKLWQNSKTEIMTKLKNSNSNQKNNFWTKFFLKNNLTPQQLMRCVRGSYSRSRDVFLCSSVLNQYMCKLSILSTVDCISWYSGARAGLPPRCPCGSARSSTPSSSPTTTYSRPWSAATAGTGPTNVYSYLYSVVLYFLMFTCTTVFTDKNTAYR